MVPEGGVLDWYPLDYGILIGVYVVAVAALGFLVSFGKTRTTEKD
jgi:hypothetical protein